MATRFSLALILLACSAFADSSMDMLRLRPTTPPAVGYEGQFRVDSSTKHLVQWNTATAAWKEISGSGGSGAGGRNLVSNPGFEDGTLGWTASGGSFTIATSGSNLLFDLKSGLFNSSAGAQTLCSAAVSVPNGFSGNAMASAYFLTSATDYLFYAFDGSSVIGESKLVTPGTEATLQAVNFVWPTSGTVQFCVESQSDAGDIAIDDAAIGAATNLILVGRPMVGFKAMDNAPTTADFTSGTDAIVFPSLGSYGYDTHGAYNTSTGEFTCPVSGRYFAVASSALNLSGALVNYQVTNYLRVNGGIFATKREWIDAAYTGVHSSSVDGTVQCERGQKLTAVVLTNTNTGTSFTAEESSNYFEAYLIQPDNQVGLIAEEGWFVDANTGAANVALATSTTSPYQGMENVNLSLTASSGSLPVEIPCSSTNPSTGSTCSAGNGQIGVAFTPTKSGHARVCFDFAVAMQPSGGGSESFYDSFKVVQTANNSQTALASSSSIAEATWVGNQNLLFSTGRRACGLFNVVKNQKQTFRLFYETTIAGSPVNHLIYTLQNSGNEPASVHVTAELANEQIPMPIIVSGLTTDDSLRNTRVIYANVTPTSGACTINSQSGNSFSVSASTANGDCTLAIAAGTFSLAPTCTFAGLDNAGTTSIIAGRLFSISTTSLRFMISSVSDGSTTVQGVAVPTHIICIGPR